MEEEDLRAYDSQYSEVEYLFVTSQNNQCFVLTWQSAV